MRKKGFPLTQVLEVYRPGAPERDRFGNLRPSAGRWEQTRVFGWAVNKVSEGDEDSVLRRIDQLDLYTPEDAAPTPDGKVRLPDGSEWAVDGHAETYEHNPWWQPGLVVIHCRRVEG